MNNLSRRKFGNMGEIFKCAYIFDTAVYPIKTIDVEKIVYNEQVALF